MQAFLLGLSNGVACMTLCAPVLVPYLLGTGGGISKNVTVTMRFLLGRLIGYLIFGVLAWGISRSLLDNVGIHDLVIGPAFMILSILLVLYGLFHRHPRNCAASTVSMAVCKFVESSPSLVPVVAGLATGLSFCPPFLLAVTGAADRGGFWATLSELTLRTTGVSPWVKASASDRALSGDRR